MLLAPIRETEEDFIPVEKRIKEILYREIYAPLVALLGKEKLKLQNVDGSPLYEAIKFGRIRFYRGKFTGRFSSRTSAELKKLGAKWSDGAWSLPAAMLPDDIRQAISVSEAKAARTYAQIDERLSKVVPEQIAQYVKIGKIFDKTIFRVEKKVKATLPKQISIPADLSDSDREKIAAQYTEDLSRYIKDWTDQEILRLRKEVQGHILSGARYEDMIKSIEDSYGVSARKAKFLARQETSLLMTAVKQNRYQSAGVNKYRWKCVVGSPKHPVRPMHKILDNKVFSWNSPPVTDNKGSRNNPGQDYNCRCLALPIVEF